MVLFKNVFIIFGCAGSLLLHIGFLQLLQAGATLSCCTWASHCSGFSVVEHRLQAHELQQLQHMASVVEARGSQRAWAQQQQCKDLIAPGYVGFPGPGIKNVSPALASGFLSTPTPGKSLDLWFLISLGGWRKQNSQTSWTLYPHRYHRHTHTHTHTHNFTLDFKEFVFYEPLVGRRDKN